MTTFPAPPAIGVCLSKISCAAKASDRKLVACDCQVEAAFANLDIGSKFEQAEYLKTERTRWHPDKFSACCEGEREGWVKMAGEVFKVVNGMYEKKKR